MKLIAQNDAFHKIKNSKKARKSEFQDPKIKSQKLHTTLEKLKLEGLKQIAIQMKNIINLSKHKRKTLVDILDPQLRSMDNIFHLVVGAKLLRLNHTSDKLDLLKNRAKKLEIIEICSKAIKAHEVDEDCTYTVEAFDETVSNCLYLDRALVTSQLLKGLEKHRITLTELHPMYLKPISLKRQSKDMSLKLKESILQHPSFKWKNESDAAKAKEFNMESKIDEEVFFRRCMLKG